MGISRNIVWIVSFAVVLSPAITKAQCGNNSGFNYGNEDLYFCNPGALCGSDVCETDECNDGCGDLAQISYCISPDYCGSDDTTGCFSGTCNYARRRTLSKARLLPVSTNILTAEEKQNGFSIQTLTQRFSGSGTMIAHYDEIVAVRSDGSKAKVRLDYNDRILGVRSIADLSEKKTIFIDPVTKTTKTGFLTSGEIFFRRASMQNCSSGNSKSILGWDVYELSRTIQSGPLQVSQEEWRAPGLGCQALEVHQRITDSKGALLQVQDTAVQNVQLGEPDPKIFEVPSDYTERTPSQWAEEVSKTRGKQCTACTSKQFQMLDDVYRSRHQQQ